MPRRKPIVLVDLADPKQKPLLFACPTCGICHSVKQYGRKEARAKAVQCTTCRPKQYRCDMCGCKTHQYWTRCDKCQYEVKLAAAEEVPDDGGPYCKFGGDTYYHEIEEARDAGLEWVSPCHVTYPKIDADSVLENLLDDMHEDASVDDMAAVGPFYEAVKAFNDAQTCQSWFGDDKRKIRVPASGIPTEGGDNSLAPFMGSPPEGDAKSSPTRSPLLSQDKSHG